MARGTVSDDHPLVMGYADPALNYAVHTAFREADLFLVVGKRIDYRLAMGGPRLFPEAAKFIQIDIHEEELGLNRRSMSRSAPMPAPRWTRSPQPRAPSRGRRRPGSNGCAAAARCAGATGRAMTELAAASRRVLPRTARGAAARTSSTPGTAAISRTGAAPSCPRGRRAAGCGWGRWEPSVRRCRTRWRCNWRIPDGAVVAITGDGALGFYIAEMDSACATSCRSC